MISSRRKDDDYRRKSRILIHHRRWSGFINQETNFAWSLSIMKRFSFCLNLGCGFVIIILFSYEWSPRCVVDRKTAWFRDSENLINIDKAIGNKDFIWLTFIFSCCLVLGNFSWSDSYCYLRYGKLRAYPMDDHVILRLASFLQRLNDGFLC